MYLQIILDGTEELDKHIVSLIETEREKIMGNLKSEESLTRAEIENIYSKFCEENVSLRPNNISVLYEKLVNLFDEYETEIVLDAFYQGYICGLASK